MDPYMIMVVIISYTKNHCLCDLDLLKSLTLNVGNVPNVVAVGTGSIHNKSSTLAIVLTGINVLIFLVGDQDSDYWSVHGYVIHECEEMGNLGCLM